MRSCRNLNNVSFECCDWSACVASESWGELPVPPSGVIAHGTQGVFGFVKAMLLKPPAAHMPISCPLYKAELDSIYIRKAFCASQLALSDFIRYFSARNGIDKWFQALTASVHMPDNLRVEDAQKDTWVGDMCEFYNSAFYRYFPWCLVVVAASYIKCNAVCI
jgi:hypothetical protein